jgi:hypothetical protein
VCVNSGDEIMSVHMCMMTVTFYFHIQLVVCCSCEVH